jgi:Ca2+-dependent lipid-binding protein
MHDYADRGMQINQALFVSNAGSGYILKPDLSKDVSSSPWTLNLKIISAQQLPKPKSAIKSTSAIIDPFIDVEIIGTVRDYTKFKTRAISSNGFNPIWKEDMVVTLTFPQMAFLRFQVYDSSNLLGTFTIHIPNLEQGYRHIPLYDAKGNLMPFSTLFVYVQFNR